MARTSAPHSATAQFFINTTDNGFLNFKAETQQGWGYAVFGKVVGRHRRGRRDREGQDRPQRRPRRRAAGRRGDRARRRARLRPADSRDAARPRRCRRFWELVAPADWRPIDFITDLHLATTTPRTFDAWAALPAQHAGRRGLHPRRPVRGLGRRRRAARWLRGQLRRGAGRGGFAQHGRLHGRQPRLSGRRRDARGVRRARPARPDRAGRLRRAAAALARRRAVPGRHRLPAVPRQVRSAGLAARLPRRGRSHERRALARSMRDAQRAAQARQGRSTDWADVDSGTRRALDARGRRADAGARPHPPAPATKTWPRGSCAQVLSDWDLDDASPPRAEVLRCAARGLARIPLDRALTRGLIVRLVAPAGASARTLARRAIPDDAVAADAGALPFPRAALRRPTCSACAS